MSDELKLCPFCEHEFDANVMERGKIMGSCSNKMCIAYGLFCSVEEWNARPLEDALQKRIGELEAQLENINALIGEKPTPVVAGAGTTYKQYYEINPYEQQASKSVQEFIQEIALLKLRIADLEKQLADKSWFKYPPAPEKGNDNV